MPSDYGCHFYGDETDSEMKSFEAQLILICKTARTTAQIWDMLRRIGREVTYNYINGILCRLFRAGLMIRRNHGRPTYYISTDKAIEDVVTYLNKRYNERIRESFRATSSIVDNRVLTEFVKA